MSCNCYRISNRVGIGYHEVIICLKHFQTSHLLSSIFRTKAIFDTCINKLHYLIVTGVLSFLFFFQRRIVTSREVVWLGPHQFIIITYMMRLKGYSRNDMNTHQMMEKDNQNN